MTGDEVRAKQKFKADRVMAPEEYAAMPLIGWHIVCKDFDGFGAIGVRFGAPSDKKYEAPVVGSALAEWCQANPSSAAQMIERMREHAKRSADEYGKLLSAFNGSENDRRSAALSRS